MNSKSLVVAGIISLLMILCAGCVDKVYTEESYNMQEEEFEWVSGQYQTLYDDFTIRIIVFHDNKRNVTCWRVGNGLSCIPDKFLSESEVKE